jgi:hypothetical protein
LAFKKSSQANTFFDAVKPTKFFVWASQANEIFASGQTIENSYNINFRAENSKK